MSNFSMETKEFDISVPWGKIAVKAWGDETNSIVLMVHGVTDNAGTFDRLIPFLPTNFHYVCIDLPGHGKSTPFPPHLPLITMNYFLSYFYVMDHFKSDSYIIIGHSYGAQIAKLVAQLMPEKVSKLVMFDTYLFWLIEPENMGENLVTRLQSFMKLEKKISNVENAPLYTYEQAKHRIMEGRWGELHNESADALLKRHLVPVGDKFRFTQDPRLKFFINPMQGEDYVLKLHQYYPLKCPVLIICATGLHLETLSARRLYEALKEQKNITMVDVVGSHDVHNNEPELVAPHVAKFLLDIGNKL